MPHQDAGRTLIICCDGTGNIWGNGHDTNIVKLFRLLEKDAGQIVYYDPGVGTTDNFPPIGPINWCKARLRRLGGLALGGGIYDDIARGYEFVVDNYQDGDRICLFGFSRGAFTVRAIAALVDDFGVIRPGAKPMLPVMVRINFYGEPRIHRSARKDRRQLADDIKRNFARGGEKIWVHLIGVWDTVESVGFTDRVTPSTGTDVDHKHYRHMRQALALDEQRNRYRPRLYTHKAPLPADRSLRQLWFAGNHSDVGGAYRESGLANVTLAWMMDEVRALGVRFKPGAQAPAGNALDLAHDEVYAWPTWTLLGLSQRQLPADAEMHPSVAQRALAGAGARTVWRPLLRRRQWWVLAAATALLLWLYRSGAALPGAARTGLSAAVCCVGALLLMLIGVHARHRWHYNRQLRRAVQLDSFSSRWPLLLWLGATLLRLPPLWARWPMLGSMLRMVQWLAGAAIVLTLLVGLVWGWRRRPVPGNRTAGQAGASGS